ncbi:MAG: hypothetical protein AB7O81_19715 [Blastocatellales bacterium]
MEKEIIVNTQEELNSIKPDFDGTVYIEGGTGSNPLVLAARFDSAYLVARGSSYLVLSGSALLNQMRGSSQVGVMRESSQVGVMRESSQVREMRGSSQVGVMRESSQVGVMWESSQVGVMWESSQVRVMWESSQVGVMRVSSQVGVLRGSSQGGVMRESSQVELYGEAYVSAYSAKQIVCHGYNIVRLVGEKKDVANLVVNKDSSLIVIPKFKPTFNEYLKRYPVEVRGKVAVLYKAVHKVGGKYLSDRDRKFEYKIGEKMTHEIDKQKVNSCSVGLHVAIKSWARCFGISWGDMAILECEVPVNKIVVAQDCDGKVRTSELAVVREVPESEWL